MWKLHCGGWASEGERVDDGGGGGGGGGGGSSGRLSTRTIFIT